MKVLLTGASGNLGGELIQRAHFDIVQLNREDWNDLNEKLGSGVKIVIHAASDIRTRAAISPVRLLDSNLLSTARLLEAVRTFQVPRFVFISSCAVYGEAMRTHEDSDCRPTSINGICKLLNERIVGEFCAAHEIKYEIYRPFNTYGGRDHFSVVSRLKHAIERKVPFTLNNMGIAQRDFIHVSDVAKVILKLLDIDVPFTHLNIGTGIATRIFTLVDLAKQRFPNLLVQPNQIEEAEYSRADISRLSGLINCDFVRIEEFMRTEFMRDQV